MRWILCTVVWGCSLALVLQTHRVSDWWPHSILCGPWGCSPPVLALVGYHLFSLVLLAPVVPLIGLAPSIFRRRVGAGLLAVGIVVAIGVIGFGAVGWWNEGRDASAQDLIRKGTYDLVMYVDMPLLQIALIGAVIWGLATRRPALICGKVICTGGR